MTTNRPPSVLDRALRLVGDVRAGEGATALTLASTVLSLLSAYYLLKVAREALLLARYGAETKVYLAGVQGLVLVPAAWFFGWLSTRVDRVRLVTVTTLFFASNLVLFAVLQGLDVPIALPFFVWVGVFNVFVIAQFWSFANDVYDEATGRRLFAVVGLGSSVGAIFGSYAASPIGELVGTRGLLLVPVALLAVSLVGYRAADGSRRRSVEVAAPPPDDSGRSGLSLLFADRYLLAIAALMILSNLENTVGEFVLDRVLQAQVHADVVASGGGEADVEGRIRDFKALYFAAVNTLGLVLQLFVAGRVLARGGAARTILVLPIVALLGQVGMLASGAVLASVALAKVAENATDYSVQNTGRNALFLITSREVKYKVKVLVDSVAMRLGDVLAGATVLVAGALELPTAGFVIANLVVTGSWVGLVTWIGREHERRRDAPREG